MSRLVGAAGLGVVGLFMLVGFLNSDAALAAPATLAALALTVGLPAAGAALLLRSHYAERDRLHGRKAALRRNTVDAELLRLAGERGGRLTAVEAATHLAMSPESAKEALDALTVRGQAELEITDAGVLVYSFYDVRHLGGKSSARGILDA
jgi:hypothetical protein